MASRRMIDPAFWQSETVANLPIPIRYFFIGLFSNADDQGRMKAHPALIRSKLYPYDDISLDEIMDWLNRLSSGEFVTLYSLDGKDYLQITNWWKYQHPRWAWPSEFPAPKDWLDRVHYRQGNAVITENWDHTDPAPADDSDESGTTVEPPRNQSGTTVEPAPSGSNSTSTSTSISGSTSTSTNPDDDTSGALAAAAAVGIGEKTARELIQQYGAERVEAQAIYVQAQKGIENPAGLAISRLKSGSDPPPPPPLEPDSRKYVEGPYAAYIQH